MQQQQQLQLQLQHQQGHANGTNHEGLKSEILDGSVAMSIGGGGHPSVASSGFTIEQSRGVANSASKGE